MTGLLSQRLVLTSIALDTCCYFTRAAGRIEVRDVLAKNRAQVVFTDTFGIAFTSDSPGGHVDVRGDPCPYALVNKVSKCRGIGWQKMSGSTHRCILSRGRYLQYHS